MRPFGCPVTILNTIDHLGKFNGKADEGFFVGYSLNSKAFRVFNSRTRIVEENLHIRFSETTSNVVGSRPDWLFDIDALTKIINYESIVAGTQSNGFVGTKASDNAGQARKETEPVKDYILLTLWTADLPFSQDPKSSHDDGFKPSSDDGKKVNEDHRKENECNDQEKEDNVNNTNNVNTVSSTVNVAGTNEDNELPFDPNMPALEDVSTFNFSSDDEDDEKTKRVIHALKDPRWIEAMQEGLLQFKLQEVWTLANLPNEKRAIGTKWVFRNKNDERGILIRNKERLVAQGYTQKEEIDYDEVFGPVVRIEAIRLVLAYALFKDFMVYQIDVKSAFLYGKIEEEVYVCQPFGFEDLDFPDRVYKVEKALYGLHQAPRAWFIEVKTASTPMETQKPLLKDEGGEKVDVYMYRSMIGSLMYLTSSRLNIMLAVCACARYQVNLKVLHLYAMKRIFRYLKSQPKLGLWYLKDSPFDLVAYTDSDYAGASLHRKSRTGGKAKKSVRLMMEKLFGRKLKLILVKGWERFFLVNDQDDGDADMFDVNVLGGEEVFATAGQNENVVNITTKELNLAQELKALKNSKPKVKGLVIQEPCESTTTTTIISLQRLHDKGKEIMIEEPLMPKKKDQIRLNKEDAKRLQAEFDEEERLAREKANRVGERKGKRAGKESIQESTKKQKVVDDKEKEELKQLMETILDEEEVAIDAIPLAVNQMHKSFNIEDLEDLYKLVKARYGSTRPVENMDLLLWVDLKTMFEPHVEDKKKYPLTPPTLSMMLEKKLQIDYESEMAYQLCKLIKKRLKKQRSVWKHPPGVD
nr:retrovirus-related Pol polyprotein from transposon TNT 1-94 [Tanacetum cinerariifolium]